MTGSSYTGAQYKHAETMTLSKNKTYPGAYTQFDSLLTAIKANPSGTYTIGADLVATPLKDGEGESYITNFSGTLESAEPEKNFTISNLNKPLFTTLTGTVKNVNLDVNISAVKAVPLLLQPITLPSAMCTRRELLPLRYKKQETSQKLQVWLSKPQVRQL